MRILQPHLDPFHRESFPERLRNVTEDFSEADIAFAKVTVAWTKKKFPRQELAKKHVILALHVPHKLSLFYPRSRLARLHKRALCTTRHLTGAGYSASYNDGINHPIKIGGEFVMEVSIEPGRII